MDGNKGFEAPKETSQDEPHVDEEVFDAEMDARIAQLDEEIKEEEKFEQRSREICEKVLQQHRLKDVVDIFGVLTEKAYYVEFSEEALLHVENLINRATSAENIIDHTSFLITCYETLERFGFPQENIARAITNRLVERRGFNQWFFRYPIEIVLKFLKQVQSSYPTFDIKFLAIPEVQSAASSQLDRSILLSPDGSGFKTPKEVIRAFNLHGPEVTRVISESIRSSILGGNLNQRKIEALYSDNIAELYYEDEAPKEESLDEAWKKLQERYEITESYQEMRRRVFEEALMAGGGVHTRNICNGQSRVLEELVTEQTLPRVLKLAEETLYIASNLKADLGGVSYGDKGWIIGAALEQFDIPLDTVRKWFEYTSSDNKLYLQRFSKVVLDPDAVLTLDILGDSASGQAYEIIKDIQSGENKDLVEETVGIHQSGLAGIQELRQLVKAFRQDILEENFDWRNIRQNPILYDLSKRYLRIDEREFGVRALVDSVELYDNQKDQVRPLDEVVYQRSEPLRIQTREIDKDFEYSEQFLSAFRTLTEDIRKARDLAQWVGPKSENKKPLSHLVEHLDAEVERVVAMLYKSRHNVHEEKWGFIDERIEKMTSLNFRDLSQLDQNLQALMKIPEAHSIVRQILFTFAYAKSDLDGMYNPPKSGTQPSLDDITGAMNFVDHIAYQETWARYFKDKKSRNNFRQIASTRALEEELERMQRSQKGEVGTTVIQFVPTRGFLMEVSGSLADACWQDRNEDLIALEHPNFTSVTFVQNPETKDERIAGACLLIESEALEGGQPLLVIRGLNPLENVINRLSVEDFYQKFTEYCEGIAERGGRKLAIVIDDHSGGSATNRPALFQYLSRLELRKVMLKFNQDTEFNGYVIANKTFLVD